jgi:hypothetical protein
VLLNRGYLKENIYYLSAEGYVDFDGDNEDDRYDFASQESLEDVLEELMFGDKSTQFVVYLSGHGGPESFRINPYQTLTATYLRGYLDTIQDKYMETNGQMIFIYDACSSGTFLPGLARTPNRTVISSAGDHPAYYFTDKNLSFSSVFWSRVYSRFSVAQSFQAGRQMMYSFQSPLLDANGDGEYDSTADPAAIQNLFIGPAGTPASDTPTIGPTIDITPGAVTSQTPDIQVDMSADAADITVWPVTDSDGINSVWMVVTPPCFEYGAAQNQIFDIPLRLANPTEKAYKVSFDSFFINGDYRISIFAKDKKGFFCTEPLEITVTKSGGSYCGIIGDLNQDKETDLGDAIIALKVLAGITSDDMLPDDYSRLGIDIDEDYRVGMPEVLYILQFTAGLRE